MALQMTSEEFEVLVTEELDGLSDDIVSGLDNVVFVVEDLSPEGDMDLLGFYDGIAVTDRSLYGYGELPDRIVLFRLPLLAACTDVDHLRSEVRVTLIHEIAHFYGIDDDELHRLGWA